MTLRRGRCLAAVGGVVLLVSALVVGAISCSGSDGNDGPSVEQTSGVGESEGQAAPLEDSEDPVTVTDKVWPATLLLHVEIDPVKQANQPSDVALLDDEMFITDPNDDRILELSSNGETSWVLDERVDPQLVLSGPMAIASGQGELYVADSEAGRVLVLTHSGTVLRAIDLAKGDPADAQPVRPIGIVVWSSGSFAVSDANNHRLLKYNSEGELLWSVGSGERDSGDTGFNVPGGLALDKGDNVYVVDILNSKIKKFSSDGTFLFAFGGAGVAAGELSRAKAIALDAAQNIYVSDGLGVAIQVFDQEGTFLGFIGRADPEDPNSGSLFQAPHGLTIVDDKLYVVDRFAGLFVFDLSATR